MYKIEGRIIHISDEKQVSEKFKVRDCVISIDGQFPQEIKIQFNQQRCDLLNGFNFNDEVHVKFMINGKKNEKSNDWYNTLVGLEIQKTIIA